MFKEPHAVDEFQKLKPIIKSPPYGVGVVLIAEAVWLVFMLFNLWTWPLDFLGAKSMGTIVILLTFYTNKFLYPRS